MDEDIKEDSKEESNEIQEKIHQLQKAFDHATANINQARQLLSELGVDVAMAPAMQRRAEAVSGQDFEGNSQIVEGVFNGQNMVGPDGKIYTIPANYASKSKLVEGDILKLTIQPDGSFLYKQIGPVERARAVGQLVFDVESGDYSVVVGKHAYKVIKASITYYKGEPGDEVVVLTPVDGNCVWAAVENVISAGSEQSASEYLEQGALAELPPGDEAELPAGTEAELTT